MVDTLGIEELHVHPPVELPATVDVDDEAAGGGGAAHAGSALLAGAAEQVLALRHTLLQPHQTTPDQEHIGDPYKAVFMKPDFSVVRILSRACLHFFGQRTIFYLVGCS